jgi:hypothetical protein
LSPFILLPHPHAAIAEVTLPLALFKMRKGLIK